MKLEERTFGTPCIFSPGPADTELHNDMDGRTGPDSFHSTKSQHDPTLLQMSAKTGKFARSRLNCLS